MCVLQPVLGDDAFTGPLTPGAWCGHCPCLGGVRVRVGNGHVGWEWSCGSPVSGNQSLGGPHHRMGGGGGGGA